MIDIYSVKYVKKMPTSLLNQIYNHKTRQNRMHAIKAQQYKIHDNSKNKLTQGIIEACKMCILKG
jgi:hypothetical protein